MTHLDVQEKPVEGTARNDGHGRIAQWFAMLDDNGDGSITRDELVAMVESHGGTAEQVTSACATLCSRLAHVHPRAAEVLHARVDQRLRRLL